MNPLTRELFVPFARLSAGSSIIFFSVLDVLYVPVLFILCPCKFLFQFLTCLFC